MTGRVRMLLKVTKGAAMPKTHVYAAKLKLQGCCTSPCHSSRWAGDAHTADANVEQCRGIVSAVPLANTQPIERMIDVASNMNVESVITDCDCLALEYCTVFLNLSGADHPKLCMTSLRQAFISIRSHVRGNLRSRSCQREMVQGGRKSQRSALPKLSQEFDD